MLVCVAECVYRVVLIFAEFHFGNGIQKFYEFFVALCYRRAEFVRVYVEIGKQTFEILFAVAALRRTFDIFKYLFKGFV